MHWIPVGASLFASNIGSEHFIGEREPEMSPDWNLSRIQELFGSFFGTFDKNEKVLWYFLKNRELFGSFFGCF